MFSFDEACWTRAPPSPAPREVRGLRPACGGEGGGDENQAQKLDTLLQAMGSLKWGSRNQGEIQLADPWISKVEREDGRKNGAWETATA